jgi:hypothetical protein
MDWDANLPRLRMKPRQEQQPPSLRIQRLRMTRADRFFPQQAQRPLQWPSFRSFSSGDRAVISVGIMMAVASASFATFMVVSDHSHPRFNGADHLMIFAQPGHGLDQPLVARVPGAPDDNDQGIDYTATGAIPGSDEPQDPRYVLPSINAPKEIILKDFTLRGVSGNVAIVDGPDGLYRLETGTALPGGGRVLSIEWRQGTFVVVTTRGVIEEAQP